MPALVPAFVTALMPNTAHSDNMCVVYGTNAEANVRPLHTAQARHAHILTCCDCASFVCLTCPSLSYRYQRLSEMMNDWAKQAREEEGGSAPMGRGQLTPQMVQVCVTHTLTHMCTRTHTDTLLSALSQSVFCCRSGCWFECSTLVRRHVDTLTLLHTMYGSDLVHTLGANA